MTPVLGVGPSLRVGETVQDRVMPGLRLQQHHRRSNPRNTTNPTLLVLAVTATMTAARQDISRAIHGTKRSGDGLPHPTDMLKLLHVEVNMMSTSEAHTIAGTMPTQSPLAMNSRDRQTTIDMEAIPVPTDPLTPHPRPKKWSMGRQGSINMSMITPSLEIEAFVLHRHRRRRNIADIFP